MFAVEADEEVDEDEFMIEFDLAVREEEFEAAEEINVGVVDVARG
jgi:hypothetical protein